MDGAGLRRDRAFVLFLTARTVSTAGTAVTLVAMPLLVLQRTGSPALASLVTAVEVVPYLVFGLVAGAVADRVDRRRLMVGADLVNAVALASVPLAAATGVLTTGHVLVAAAVVATGFVWFDAAAFGALPALVGRDRLGAANGVVWSIGTTVEVAFPAVGGLLVAALGAAYALAADSASYLLSAVALLLVPRAFQSAATAEATRGRLGADIRAGLAFIRHQPAVRTLTVLGVGNSLTAGAVIGLLAVYATRGLGLDVTDGRIGVLYTAPAVGGLLAALAVAPLGRRLPPGLISLAAFTANPLLLAGIALAPTLPVALVTTAAWATASSLAILNGITVRQLLTPDTLQSRVNATARLVAWGGTPFGATAAGLLAERLDVRTVLALATVPVAVSAAYGWVSGLRRLTLEATSIPLG